MADKGHEMTDEILNSLIDQIAEEYADALKAAEKKLKEYLDAFNAEDEIQKQRLNDGEITKEEYNAWAIRQKLNGKHWEEMRDTLAADFHNANEIALGIAQDRMPDVYALNHNFGVYEIESSGRIYTGMTLYNHDTAEYLLSQQRQLMPGPSTAKQKQIAANKDMQWNQKKIQSAVLQGILLGDGPEATAQRLMGVAQMNYNAALRYARTMTTSAQNAGRYESYRRASRLGVDLTIEWQATLDMHTRHDHRKMHGQKTEIDKPFHTPDGYTIMYPADCTGESTAPQGQIWNCRCTLRPWVKGFEGKTVTESPGMEGLSFEEWQEARPEYYHSGRHQVETRNKAAINRKRDTEQYAKYLAALGDNAPKSLDDFQNLKYNNPEKWEELKAQYRQTSSGSRQRREKRERISEMPSVTKTSVDNQKTISWVKPIVGKHSRSDDAARVNPNYTPLSFEWSHNCQRCVPTYEARRRGYDVTALPCASYGDRFLAADGWLLPYDRGDRKPTRLWQEKGLKITESRSFTKEQCLETISDLMHSYGNGARAIIDGKWQFGNGHVFIAENIDGIIHFIDPQTGDMNCLDFFDRMIPASLNLFRIDDLPFNDNIKEVFRNDVT